MDHKNLYDGNKRSPSKGTLVMEDSSKNSEYAKAPSLENVFFEGYLPFNVFKINLRQD